MMPRLRLVPSALALLALGCSGGPDRQDTCDTTPRPAFALTVQPTLGELPADTVLRVSYGAGEETYSLAAPPPRPRVLFCKLVSAGDAGSAPKVLACELWTDGAASVEISGGEFPPLERQLSAERDECGLVTVRDTLGFGPPADGGA